MKRINIVVLLLLVSMTVKSESYLILSLQGQSGQNNLKHSTSALTNIGLGLKNASGFYVDWTLGTSTESLAELFLDDGFDHDENRQRAQMDLMAGYSQRVTERTFVKVGIGLEAALFDENCRYIILEARNACERRREYGASYKLGYFYKPRKSLIIGLEYNRDELSEVRKYNGLAIVVNTGF